MSLTYKSKRVDLNDEDWERKMEKVMERKGKEGYVKQQ